jgi:hypothetical protein
MTSSSISRAVTRPPGGYQRVDRVLGLLRSLAGRSGGTFLSEVHDLLAGDEQGGD